MNGILFICKSIKQAIMKYVLLTTVALLFVAQRISAQSTTNHPYINVETSAAVATIDAPAPGTFEKITIAGLAVGIENAVEVSIVDPKTGVAVYTNTLPYEPCTIDGAVFTQASYSVRIKTKDETITYKRLVLK